MKLRLSGPFVVAVLSAITAVSLAALLVNIFTRQQVATNDCGRVDEL